MEDAILTNIARSGGSAHPRSLINALLKVADYPAVIEGLQCAIERGQIILDDEGMVVTPTKEG